MNQYVNEMNNNPSKNAQENVSYSKNNYNQQNLNNNILNELILIRNSYFKYNKNSKILYIFFFRQKERLIDSKGFKKSSNLKQWNLSGLLALANYKEESNSFKLSVSFIYFIYSESINSLQVPFIKDSNRFIYLISTFSGKKFFKLSLADLSCSFK